MATPLLLRTLAVLVIPIAVQAQSPTDPISVDTLLDVPEDATVRIRVVTWDSTWKQGRMAYDPDMRCRLVAPGARNQTPDDILYPLSRILEIQASVTASKGGQQWHPIRLDLALAKEPSQCRPGKRAAGS